MSKPCSAANWIGTKPGATPGSACSTPSPQRSSSAPSGSCDKLAAYGAPFIDAAGLIAAVRGIEGEGNPIDAPDSARMLMVRATVGAETVGFRPLKLGHSEVRRRVSRLIVTVGREQSAKKKGSSNSAVRQTQAAA